VCQACEVRFYDLARQPIVCPSCGAHFTASAQATVTWDPRVPSPGGKTGWRSKPFKRPKPALPIGDPEEPAPEIPRATEETPGAVPENDLVLEQEPDDSDVTEWVDRDVAEPKET